MYINIADLDLIGLFEMKLPLYLKEPITIQINNLDNVIHTAFQACWWSESLKEQHFLVGLIEILIFIHLFTVFFK